MRISGGVLKGRTLRVSGSERFRPTTDRVRQAIFNILGPGVIESSVLDLYAGTGSLGIEALSRGARRAWFVERDGRKTFALRETLKIFGLAGQSEIVRSPVERFLTTCFESFDLILADPPYETPDEQITGLLHIVASGTVLAPDGMILLERGWVKGTRVVPENLAVRDERTYGRTTVIFYERKNHEEKDMRLPGDF